MTTLESILIPIMIISIVSVIMLCRGIIIRDKIERCRYDFSRLHLANSINCAFGIIKQAGIGHIRINGFIIQIDIENKRIDITIPRVKDSNTSSDLLSLIDLKVLRMNIRNELKLYLISFTEENVEKYTIDNVTYRDILEKSKIKNK